MAFKTAEFVLGADVADTASTAAFAYPTGTNQAFFTGNNASATGIVIINDNDRYTEASSDVTIVYGSSTITIQNDTGGTWAAGSKVLAGLAFVDDLIAADVTATAAEVNNAADLSGRQRAVTATSDGLTTGALTTADIGRFLNITSANANHIVKLPAAGAAFIGGVIEMWVGANGFEIRADGTAATINGLDCKTTNEMAIAATHRVRLTLVAAETWLAEGDTELGARVTLVPDPV